MALGDLSHAFIEQRPTSSNFALPLSSSSLSLRRSCKFTLSLSRAPIRRASWVVFLRNFCTSMDTPFKRSWSSDRERCASDKSARVTFKSSVRDEPVSDDGCFLGAAMDGEGPVRWTSWPSEEVLPVGILLSPSWKTGRDAVRSARRVSTTGKYMSV